MKRIEIARGAFNSMLKTITARHISMKTRNIIIKAYVWSTLLYGCETWTITTRNMKTLQSFEMWAYRKMMKISWRENKTNEEVLEMVDEQLYINSPIENRKITYFDHMIRRSNIHRAVVGWSTGGESKQRKAKNGVDDKHHRMDGNAIRRPCETVSRSGAMESHDSHPSSRRRHLMMMMRV